MLSNMIYQPGRQYRFLIFNEEAFIKSEVSLIIIIIIVVVTIIVVVLFVGVIYNTFIFLFYFIILEIYTNVYSLAGQSYIYFHFLFHSCPF